jgi:hypothetical protein
VEDISSLSGGGGCGDCPWESRAEADSGVGGRDSEAGSGVGGEEVYRIQSYAFDGDVAGAGRGKDKPVGGTADFVGCGDEESEDEAIFEASGAAGEVFSGGVVNPGGWERP